MGAESAAGLGIDLFSNLFKLATGSWQVIQGAKGLKGLNRPVYSPDGNIKYNANLAGQRASQGYGSQFLNLAGDAIDRGLGSTIGAQLSSGQGVNAVNNSFQASNEAFKNLLIADAQQKIRNQEVLMNAKKDLAEENMKAFNWNQAIPYQQEFVKYSNMVNSGMQNMYGGQKGAGADAIALGDAFGGYGNRTGNQSSYSTYNWNPPTDYSQWLQMNQGYQNSYPPGYGGYGRF